MILNGYSYELPVLVAHKRYTYIREGVVFFFN